MDMNYADKNMVSMDDLDAMKEKMASLGDEDFAPLASNSQVHLHTDDFPALAQEGEGAEVMLVIKGRVGQVGDTLTVDAMDAALIHGMLPRLGSGERFARLKAKLAGRPGVYNPAGLSAYIGRKRYGKKKFQQLAARGTPGY